MTLKQGDIVKTRPKAGHTRSYECEVTAESDSHRCPLPNCTDVNCKEWYNLKVVGEDSYLHQISECEVDHRGRKPEPEIVEQIRKVIKEHAKELERNKNGGLGVFPYRQIKAETERFSCKEPNIPSKADSAYESIEKSIEEIQDAVARQLPTSLNYKELLDEALTHLDWLTVGGEFSSEAANKQWSFASAKEFYQAKEFCLAIKKKLKDTEKE